MSPPMSFHRRAVLVQSLLAAGAISAQVSASQAASWLQIENVTRLYPVEVARVATPRSTDEVRSALAAWPGELAVGGGRFSMGGHRSLTANGGALPHTAAATHENPQIQLDWWSYHHAIRQIWSL